MLGLGLDPALRLESEGLGLEPLALTKTKAHKLLIIYFRNYFQQHVILYTRAVVVAFTSAGTSKVSATIIAMFLKAVWWGTLVTVINIAGKNKNISRTFEIY